MQLIEVQFTWYFENEKSIGKY